jgi:hypothetical protein
MIFTREVWSRINARRTGPSGRKIGNPVFGSFSIIQTPTTASAAQTNAPDAASTPAGQTHSAAGHVPSVYVPKKIQPAKMVWKKSGGAKANAAIRRRFTPGGGARGMLAKGGGHPTFIACAAGGSLLTHQRAFPRQGSCSQCYHVDISSLSMMSGACCVSSEPIWSVDLWL